MEREEFEEKILRQRELGFGKGYTPVNFYPRARKMKICILTIP